MAVQEFEGYHIRAEELMRLHEDGETALADVKEQLRALQDQLTQHTDVSPSLLSSPKLPSFHD